MKGAPKIRLLKAYESLSANDLPISVDSRIQSTLDSFPSLDTNPGSSSPSDWSLILAPRFINIKSIELTFVLHERKLITAQGGPRTWIQT